MGLKKFIIKKIRNLQSRYGPTKYLPEDWEGDVLDILSIETRPPEDRIWAALNLLDERANRLFAIHCAEKALSNTHHPDSRSVKAIKVARRYVNGGATKEELKTAVYSARSAIYASAVYSAHFAAVSADSAAYAAYYAAESAYYSTNDAKSAASWSSYYAAATYTRKQQIAYLKRLIKRPL